MKKDEKIKIKNWKNEPENYANIKEKTYGVFEKDGCYWITKNGNGDPRTVKLTNWTAEFEAIMVKRENERDRKINIKSGNYRSTAFLDSSALTNVSRFRSFLLNNCDITCSFYGNDNDLHSLVEFWGKQSEPIIIKETECVGEIPEGFIAENVFVGIDGKVQEITEGLAYLTPKRAVQVAKFTTKSGKIAGLPWFPLNEPEGGIKRFKAKVFDLMVKNRNLKVAIGLGWLKACIWSNMFYSRKKWFPLFMTHGRKECGKSVFATWLLSILGMRDLKEISIRKSQYEAGSERHLAYYSSLPVHFCDYRKGEKEGQRFHSFFRNVFDRSSVSKGKKNDPVGVRQVDVRGCLLLDGEHSTPDAGLNSRMITFELTQDERVEKYYNELVGLEPDFSYIGIDWIKHRIKDFDDFMAKFNEIEKILRKSIPSPRQAQCWSVAVAAALTEPYFANYGDKIVQYAIGLANREIIEQKNEETIGSLWEAVDILNKISDEVFFYDWSDRQLKIHLPGLLAAISGDSRTRQYELPSVREVAKLLKQEPYVVDSSRTCRCGNKLAKRFVLDVEHEDFPEILKNLFGETQNDEI